MSRSGLPFSGFRAVADDMLAGARGALLRFPVPSAAFLLLAWETNLEIAGRGLLPGHEELELPLASLACASLAVNLGCEARGRSGWHAHALAAAAGVLAFALLFWNRALNTFEWPMLAGLAGLVLIAAFIGRGGSRAFWMFGVRFAFAVLLAGLALLLVAGGLSAIFASLTYLFGVEIPERAYEHVWASTGLLVAPLFGLGQIPSDFDAEPDATAQAFMDRGVRSLGDYVAAPLLLVYAVILHAYALKIVATGDVPEGQIGWLVLCYGASLMAALIVIHPFLNTSRAPTRFVARVWPLLLPVPLVLLAYAVALRIGEYGVTPDRYLLALFGLVVAAIILIQIPKASRGDIRWIVGLPVLALLFAGFGPQGALATSIRSQLARFESLVARQPLELDRHREALSALRFLLYNGAVSRAAPQDLPITEPNGSPKPEERLFRDIAAAHGIDPDLRITPTGAFSRSFSAHTAQPIDGFDIVVPMVALTQGPQSQTRLDLPGGQQLSIALAETAVEVGHSGTHVRFPIPPAAVESMATIPMPDARSEPPAEPLALEADGRRILLMPTFIHGELAPEPHLRTLSGTILLRARDWP